MSHRDSLSSIFFTDLLLSEKEAFYKIGGHGEFKSISAYLRDDALALYGLCRETTQQDSRVTYDNINYRCSKMFTVAGLVYALRRPMAAVPEFSSLGYYPALARRLIDNSPDGVQHGLVVFCGVTCSGKSTSAGAMIAERLKLHGGLAVTIEDPPELPLQGVYGEGGHGRCYQCGDISYMGGVAATGASILRFGAPNIVMYGEIRDGKAAAEAIRAALSGHLIIVTLHASGIKEGIERLIGYATEAIGHAAPLQLATALNCVIHQRLAGNGKDKLQLYADSLFVNDSVRAKIRDEKLYTLEDEITQQKNLMLLMPRGR